MKPICAYKFCCIVQQLLATKAKGLKVLSIGLFKVPSKDREPDAIFWNFALAKITFVLNSKASTRRIVSSVRFFNRFQKVSKLRLEPQEPDTTATSV
jgi:hypothetical protein